MDVQFREFNPFDVWIWLEFESIPSPAERQYIEELFDSWFYLGKLGGFNAESLQIQEEGVDISYMDYRDRPPSDSLVALMHNMGEFEYQGNWGRCWFDLGTSDAIALDILINALRQLSLDFVTVSRLIIGGENEDWEIPKSHDAQFAQYN